MVCFTQKANKYLDIKSYLHKSGRVGRIGNPGLCINLVELKYYPFTGDFCLDVNLDTMEVLPSTLSEFRSREYWNEFYKKPQLSDFDWYGNVDEILNVLSRYRTEIQREDVTIINVGCGNSVLPRDLHSSGFRRIYNLDFSEVVLNKMKTQYAELDLEWVYMDVSSASYKDFLDNVSPCTPMVIVDKAFFDSYISLDDKTNNTSIRERAKHYLTNTFACLKPEDVFIMVTLGQDYVISELVRNILLKKLHVDIYPMGHGSVTKSHLVHFIFCIYPEKNEASSTEQVTLYSKRGTIQLNACKMAHHISQERLAVYLGPNIRKYTPGQRLTFDLIPSEDSNLHFNASIYDVKNPGRSKTLTMAILIPTGYENSYSFATNEGIEELAINFKFKRAIIVWLKYMENNSKVENPFDKFKTEVFAYVKAHMSDILMQLSVEGSKNVVVSTVDSESRVMEFIAKVPSLYVGSIMVRDIQCVDGGMRRQMLFGNAPQIVQSEVAYEMDSNNSCKFLFDVACNDYHLAIALGIGHLASLDKRIAILGGGAGVLTNLLASFLNVNMDVVEMDEAVINLAHDYFGFHYSNKYNLTHGIPRQRNGIVNIQGDAFVYLQSIAPGDVHVIIADINNGSCENDSSNFNPTILKSPDPRFFEMEQVETIVKLLTPSNGMFLVNLLTRNESVRTEILDTLALSFPLVAYITMPEDVNIVVLCMLIETQEELDKRYKAQVSSSFRYNIFSLKY
ncbi:bifunctional S-adenosyl-L-methionine-dependent methyltransferase superfamily/P-loop containing nucleoside triphosphate hydrolase [Babesia duncani]|uniref:Bifunctional S-adenosyl-L-methionine-dependent methyltransferase superfamily/P-loop containing nucleoside triphosphate hydrolase n=1 Tax=Babesia duncani TaxID=323732 RepID=A0AAD9PLN9_9APIC|nr:bifunctional S-adenosyl-L-methionine-dependent methyltransferase superfamily/P-loop containing nucleoside triphosphate hydrolase [Babesia duncani]